MATHKRLSVYATLDTNRTSTEKSLFVIVCGSYACSVSSLPLGDAIISALPGGSGQSFAIGISRAVLASTLGTGAISVLLRAVWLSLEAAADYSVARAGQRVLASVGHRYHRFGSAMAFVTTSTLMSVGAALLGGAVASSLSFDGELSQSWATFSWRGIFLDMAVGLPVLWLALALLLAIVHVSAAGRIALDSQDGDSPSHTGSSNSLDDREKMLASHQSLRSRSVDTFHNASVPQPDSSRSSLRRYPSTSFGSVGSAKPDWWQQGYPHVPPLPSSASAFVPPGPLPSGAAPRVRFTSAGPVPLVSSPLAGKPVQSRGSLRPASLAEMEDYTEVIRTPTEAANSPKRPTGTFVSAIPFPSPPLHDSQSCERPAPTPYEDADVGDLGTARFPKDDGATSRTAVVSVIGPGKIGAAF